MPLYSYDCMHCKMSRSYFRTLAAYKRAPQCPKCRRRMKLGIGHVKEQQVSSFKPYVEHNAGPAPIRIDSKAERDKMLADKGLTYDTVKDPKPKRAAWEKDPSVKREIMERIQKGEADARH